MALLSFLFPVRAFFVSQSQGFYLVAVRWLDGMRSAPSFVFHLGFCQGQKSFGFNLSNVSSAGIELSWVLNFA
jgi:hypothetical protein